MITWSLTPRFFRIGTFKDRYKKDCSIQESSLAEEACLWLGIDKAEPQIMATDAIKLGMDTKGQTGWVPYPLPEEVTFNTRMHLTQEMAEELIPILAYFVKTGYLPKPADAEQQQAFNASLVEAARQKARQKAKEKPDE